jgi:Lar family restriction alleviation protein
MTDIIPVSDLLPCPFCGGPASLWTPEQRRELKLGCAREPACDQCGASLGFFASHAEAVKGWNTRPLSTDKERLIEAVELLRQTMNALACTDKNDPLEPIADNGMTVWDGMRAESERLWPKVTALLASLQDHQS